MKEILGHNLKQFFDKNDNVKNTYTGEEYEVWEVSDEIFSRMSNMSENEFIKLAGEGSWWRFANGCSLERPTSSAFINGQYIKCWGKDDIYSEKYERDEFNDEVDALTEYLCNCLGTSTETNICACATALAKYNDMTLGKLFRKYEGYKRYEL